MNIKIKCHWGKLGNIRPSLLFENPTFEDVEGIGYGIFMKSENGSIRLGSTNPMMFTGFTDANGVEIFEGDILSEQFESDGEVHHSKEQVFWSDLRGAWCVDESFLQNKTAFYYLCDRDPSCVVIGNIVHDSDLLKGGNQ